MVAAAGAAVKRARPTPDAHAIEGRPHRIRYLDTLATSARERRQGLNQGRRDHAHSIGAW
jgi:hypothetical protein